MNMHKKDFSWRNMPHVMILQRPVLCKMHQQLQLLCYSLGSCLTSEFEEFCADVSFDANSIFTVVPLESSKICRPSLNIARLCSDWQCCTKLQAEKKVILHVAQLSIKASCSGSGWGFFWHWQLNRNLHGNFLCCARVCRLVNSSLQTPHIKMSWLPVYATHLHWRRFHISVGCVMTVRNWGRTGRWKCSLWLRFGTQVYIKLLISICFSIFTSQSKPCFMFTGILNESKSFMNGNPIYKAVSSKYLFYIFLAQGKCI